MIEGVRIELAFDRHFPAIIAIETRFGVWIRRDVDEHLVGWVVPMKIEAPVRTWQNFRQVQDATEGVPNPLCVASEKLDCPRPCLFGARDVAVIRVELEFQYGSGILDGLLKVT